MILCDDIGSAAKIPTSVRAELYKTETAEVRGVISDMPLELVRGSDQAISEQFRSDLRAPMLRFGVHILRCYSYLVRSSTVRWMMTMMDSLPPLTQKVFCANDRPFSL